MWPPDSTIVSTFHSTVENMSGIAEAVHFPLSTRLYKAWKGGKKPQAEQRIEASLPELRAAPYRPDELGAAMWPPTPCDVCPVRLRLGREIVRFFREPLTNEANSTAKPNPSESAKKIPFDNKESIRDAKGCGLADMCRLRECSSSDATVNKAAAGLGFSLTEGKTPSAEAFPAPDDGSNASDQHNATRNAHLTRLPRT